MKTFIFSLMMSLSVASLARPIYLTGHGYFSQTCFGGNFSCVDLIKRMSEDQGRRDVLYSCQAQRGTLLNASCNTFCNPSYIPINQPQTFVSCSSTCSGACEIQP